jgi:hypothetical protein
MTTTKKKKAAPPKPSLADLIRERDALNVRIDELRGATLTTQYDPLDDFDGILGDTVDRQIFIDGITNADGRRRAAEQLAYVLVHLRKAGQQGTDPKHFAREAESMLHILFARTEWYSLAFELFSHPDHLSEDALEQFRRFVATALGRDESEVAR